VFGRSVFKGVKVAAAGIVGALFLCARVALLGAEGRPQAFFGGFALWVFAAYSIQVVGSIRKRS